MSRPDAERVQDAVQAHSPALLAYFARRVDPTHEAADLLAETLLQLWKRAASLPEREDEARPWMFGIARNVLLHHYRSSTRRRAVADRLRGILDAGPDAGFESGHEFDELHTALADLDPVDRDIIGLLHWEGFSLVEIAGITGMKAATVRSRYHRARGALRERLCASDPEPEAARRM